MDQFAKINRQNKGKWCKIINGKYYEVKNSVYDDFIETDTVPIEFTGEVQLLPPCDAEKVIALAYNYKGLVGEKEKYDEPLFFFKSLTGLVGHKGVVVYPKFATKVWHEVELAVVVKTKCKNVSVEDADKYILGYTCGNDITCENILNRDWHLARSKGLDTFCPLGPFLVKGINTSHLRLKSYINNKVTQDSYTSNRILNDKEAVSLISRYVTLFPGDVILTGTPAGATDAIIHPGDEIRVEVEGLGILGNHVNEEEV